MKAPRVHPLAAVLGAMLDALERERDREDARDQNTDRARLDGLRTSPRRDLADAEPGQEEAPPA